MTNEEKAREIIGCPCFMKRDCEACFERINLLTMASWKEQQIIEKAVEWLEEHMTGYEQSKYIDNFKKAMEE